jgi:transcriptional regulator with XRE-family HTH domain
MNTQYSNEAFHPLALIRVARQLTLEDTSKYFEVSKAYISAVEKGIRKMNENRLKLGLNNMNIEYEKYIELESYVGRIQTRNIPLDKKYAYSLMLAIGVSYPYMETDVKKVCHMPHNEKKKEEKQKVYERKYIDLEFPRKTR